MDDMTTFYLDRIEWLKIKIEINREGVETRILPQMSLFFTSASKWELHQIGYRTT